MATNGEINFAIKVLNQLINPIKGYNISTEEYNDILFKRIKQLENQKNNIISIGSTVNWRGSWGMDVAKPVNVKRIEICEEGQKEGVEVESVSYEELETKNVVFSLDNGHWAYGYQIDKFN